jgi:ubiquinone/menaquinone biosynthesis C-methylase UbiE
MSAGAYGTLRVGLALVRSAVRARSLEGFYDSLAARYDSLFGEVQRRRAAELVDRIAQDGGPLFGRALDLGAGTGILTRELRRVASRVVALDLSAGMLRVAREVGGQAPDLDYVQGSFLDLPFIDRSFDLVSGLGMMSHVSVTALQAWMDNIDRVLRRPGTIRIAFSPCPWRIFAGGRSVLRASFVDRVLAALYNAFLAALRLNEKRRIDDPGRVGEKLEQRGFCVTLSECGSLVVLGADRYIGQFSDQVIGNGRNKKRGGRG